MTEKLLRVKDVAERLNVTKPTAYALINEGQLPYLRVGSGRGTIRVRPADLEQFINQSLISESRREPQLGTLLD